MKKKITILVTGIFITVAAISGCGSDPTNKTETPKAEATTRLDLSSESTATETTTEKKEEVTTKSKPTTTAEKSASSEIRPEVKKAIDSYESFMNEYIDFMKKYSESDDAVSMANDYAEYMEKYTKVVKDFDALKNNNLNDAELKYYLEVQNKINTDLISIQ